MPDSFLRLMGISGGRWFDKTPQNIYGMLLLSAVYPDAKFVHIVRHPLNVVTSLKAGKVMAKHSLQGGHQYLAGGGLDCESICSGLARADSYHDL